MFDPNTAPAAPKAIASTEENSQANRDQVISKSFRWVIMYQTKAVKATSTTDAVTSVVPEMDPLVWPVVLIDPSRPAG
jgi:hypothetical protein